MFIQEYLQNQGKDIPFLMIELTWVHNEIFKHASQQHDHIKDIWLFSCHMAVKWLVTSSFDQNLFKLLSWKSFKPGACFYLHLITDINLIVDDSQRFALLVNDFEILVWEMSSDIWWSLVTILVLPNHWSFLLFMAKERVKHLDLVKMIILNVLIGPW